MMSELEEFKGEYIDEPNFLDQKLEQVRLKELSTSFHRSIGVLASVGEQKVYMYETGFLLSPNMVLVSASVVHDKKLRQLKARDKIKNQNKQKQESQEIQRDIYRQIQLQREEQRRIFQQMRAKKKFYKELCMRFKFIIKQKNELYQRYIQKLMKSKDFLMNIPKSVYSFYHRSQSQFQELWKASQINELSTQYDFNFELIEEGIYKLIQNSKKLYNLNQIPKKMSDHPHESLKYQKRQDEFQYQSAVKAINFINQEIKLHCWFIQKLIKAEKSNEEQLFDFPISQENIKQPQQFDSISKIDQFEKAENVFKFYFIQQSNKISKLMEIADNWKEKKHQSKDQSQEEESQQQSDPSCLRQQFDKQIKWFHWPSLKIYEKEKDSSKKVKEKPFEQQKFSQEEQIHQDIVNLRFYLPSKETSYLVEQFIYPVQFDTVPSGRKHQFDNALVKLKEKVDYEQFMEVCAPCTKCLLQNNAQNLIELFGFPANEENSSLLHSEHLGNFIPKQYGLRKKNAVAFVDPKESIIGHTITTYSGQSGCPIKLNDRIIGFHLGSGDYGHNFNVARLFDKEFLEDISKKCHQMNGQHIKIGSAQPCKHSSPKYMKLQEEKIKLRNIQGQSNEKELFYYKNQNYNRNYEQNWQSLPQKWEKLTSIIYLKEQTQKIKYLNLSCQDSQSNEGFKLTSKHIQLFRDMKLPCLNELNLQNNSIQDEGLEILSGCTLPQLRLVNLEDNGITIEALSFIVFNDWSPSVRFKLYYVYSRDKEKVEYYLNVGQCLPIMKKIGQSKDMNEVDHCLPIDRSKTLNALKLFLHIPHHKGDEQDLVRVSQELQKRYKQQSQNSISSLATVLLKLKQILGGSLHFTKQSSMKSALSSKIIFSYMLDERISFRMKLQKFKDFQFSSFRNNSKRLIYFQAQLLRYLRQKYGVVTTDMTVDRVAKGCIEVFLSDSCDTTVCNKKLLQEKVVDEVQIFFNKLELSQEQFDKRGNRDFLDISQAQIQIRGGLPYYQPVLGKRIGVLVSKWYDGGCDDWLEMNGNKDEWAISFHGTVGRNMRSIMDGRAKGGMLREGRMQLYESDECLKNGFTVGKGVYASPYFLDCLLDYSGCRDRENYQQYFIVLQCRVRPTSVKMPKEKPNYWVVNERSQIRPYGIILFTRNDVQRLRNIGEDSALEAQSKIFKQLFTEQTWNSKYKQIYEDFIGLQ